MLYLGEFGVVYKGSLQNESFSETVAIKTLKGNLNLDLIHNHTEVCFHAVTSQCHGIIIIIILFFCLGT